MDKQAWVEAAVLELTNDGEFFKKHQGVHSAINGMYWLGMRSYLSHSLVNEGDTNKRRSRNLLRDALCEYYDDTTQSEDNNQSTNTTKGTTIMSTIKPEELIKTVTFINGRDIDKVSDDEAFSLIADVEKEINRLDGIENKPKKLVARIKDLNSQVGAIIKVIDER